MKVIIAGSRSITNQQTVVQAIEQSGFDITEVVSGTARGVDRLGEAWAEQNNVPVKRFPADWRKWGYIGGFKRNEQMAEYADALIAIWDGGSGGTRHMIRIARERGLKVFVCEVAA